METSIVGSVLAGLILAVTISAEAPATAQAQAGSSPLSPAPIGTTLSGIVECGQGCTSHELYDMKITLLEVVRGEEA